MTEITPRVRRAPRWLSGSLALTSLFTFLPSAPAALATPPDTPDISASPPDVRIPKRDRATGSRLDVSLEDDAAAGRFVPSGLDATALSEPPAGEITVVVEASSGAVAATAAEASGGTVIAQLPTLVKATVPAAELEDLANAPGVTRVREPIPIQLDEMSEGVAETLASDWQGASWTGAGTKIAVLDGGFSGYAAKRGTELPALVETDFSRCGGTGSSTHGTAVAEIAHDIAPGATLRLVCIQSDVDFIAALATMQTNGVKVVNGSFGFTLAGRGDGADGTGTIAEAVRKLRDQGILYVASAGNSEGRHSHRPATGDPVGNESDFVDMDSTGDVDMRFEVPAGGSVRVELQWDAWPSTHQDFDLYVFGPTCSGSGSGWLNSGSEGLNNQATGSNVPPVEAVEFSNCRGEDQVFWVLIDRFAGTATPRFDLFFQGDVYSPIEHPTSSSIVEPATSSSVMAVGAHCEASGGIEPFSSRGPTIDGRVKPDISGPDGTSSSVYGAQSGCSGGFLGTSASAPHVAGAAALLLEANAGLDVAELQELLESRAQDAGAPGVDNVFGAGRLRLGPAGDASVASPQPYTGITPTRLFDSRPGTAYPSEGAAPGRTTPLGAGTSLPIRVRGIGGVPVDAVAVVLNVTAVSPTAAGWLAVYPGGALPTSSNTNFAAGQTVAVHVTATVGSDDRIRIRNAVGNTHVIVDIAGWYGATGSSGPGTDRLTTLTSPARALDSRLGGPQGYAEGAFGPAGRTTPIPAGGELTVQVAGLGGVPAQATAVVMNVTAVTPTAGTFLTAYPTGQDRPDASNLNAKAGQTVANLVVLPVGPGGRVSVYNKLGNTHLVVDVVGWFRPGVGAGYVALDPPTRNLDTRTGTGLRRTALPAGGTYRLKVARYNGVPADAAAVMVGVAAVGPTRAGWLAIFPGSGSPPGTSNINFAVGATMANAVVTRLGADGFVSFYNALGTTHVISDLAGYFIDPANVPT